jgi:toxin ParE1/3/4
VRIITLPRANEDIDEQFHFIAQDSFDVAWRFFEAVEQACSRLGDMPHIGIALDFDNPELRGLRMWPVPGFEKSLIFYQVVSNAVTIVRILHSSRDIENILEEEI